MIMRAKSPTLPMTGGCSCGAIRYEIGSFPLLLYTCNCTDCQTRSGSAFALNMPVTAGGFHILKGEPKPWHYTSPKGASVTSWFCGDCGARIYGDRVGRTDIVNVRAGTLDDTSWLKPLAHFFTRGTSAQSWVSPVPDATCFETQPEGWGELHAAWRAMWPDFFPEK
jgi:hypothetical protein